MSHYWFGITDGRGLSGQLQHSIAPQHIWANFCIDVGPLSSVCPQAHALCTSWARDNWNTYSTLVQEQQAHLNTTYCCRPALLSPYSRTLSAAAQLLSIRLQARLVSMRGMRLQPDELSETCSLCCIRSSGSQAPLPLALCSRAARRLCSTAPSLEGQHTGRSGPSREQAGVTQASPGQTAPCTRAGSAGS